MAIEHTVSRVEPDDRAGWRRWLRAHHRTARGVWMVFRKGAARQITYEAAVEEALCFGWIDSLMRPIDGTRYMQLFTPRKPKSHWSALNKRRVEALIARKQMTKAGLAKIEAATQDGSWTKLDAVESMIIPPDLARALAKNPRAKAFFDASAPSSRKGALYWITGVKSADLRAKRIAHVVAQAAKGLRPGHEEAALAKGKAAARRRSQKRKS